MHEVVRGSHAGESLGKATSRPELGSISPSAERQPRVSGSLDTTLTRASQDHANASPAARRHSTTSRSPHRHISFSPDSNDSDPSPRPLAKDRRRSSSFFRNNTEDRPEADVYYDSRAATKREWRRRATTLQDYYKDNPELLPQLPFTWHRGKKRWRLIALITLMWIDACVVPIALYYGMHYGGDIEGWIIFAVVTTIWGGPTYLEFGIRTIKLIKKERFYRPLGTDSRWCFDYLTYVSIITITAVTALFIVGSAPHIVWLRVLCMPMPALLYCLGFLVGYPTLYHKMGWPAPHRFSSTGKGERVKPGVYYFVEDTVAVNANAGRPYREALAARYDASPRFQQMMYLQSLFWSIPALILAVPLTVIAVIHSVPATAAYGICEYLVFYSRSETNIHQAGLFRLSGPPYGVSLACGGASAPWCTRDWNGSRQKAR